MSEDRKKSGFPWLMLLMSAVIVALTFLCYLPAVRGPFIWDDNHMVYNNALIRKGVADGLGAFWFTKQNFDYFPLTSTTLWIEWRLFEMNPTGYRVINILLHALSALLVWRVLKRLKVSAAWLIGLLFAVHPVAVGSVAWIAERKNTLSMFFFMLSFLWFLRFEDRRLEGSSKYGWYAVSLVSFLAALFSKTHTVMLPVVLLLVIWWREGGLKRQHIMLTAPFFLASLLLGLVSMYFQYTKAIGPGIVRPEGYLSRVAGVGWCYGFYLYKALVPLNLMAVNPRWDIRPAHILHWVPLFLVVTGICLLWIYRKRWGRPAAAGLGYHAITLLPVLGLLNIYFMRFSLVGDHWHYFSYIGPVAVVVGGAAHWCSGRGEKWRRAGVAGGVVLALAMSVLSYRQAALYSDETKLWLHNIEKNPDGWVAYNNLGTLMSMGSDASVDYFSEAVRLNQRYQEAWYGLGLSLRARGELDRAIDSFVRAVTLRPDYFLAQNALGSTYMLKGRFREAIPHLEQAVATRDNYRDAWVNLGIARIISGQADTGWSAMDRAVELGYPPPAVHSALGEILMATGQEDKARDQFMAALRIGPDAKAQYGLALMHMKRGEAQQALDRFQQALQIAPDFVEARFQLAELLFAYGHFEEAAQHYNVVIQLNPNIGPAWIGVGNCHFNMENIDAALRQYQMTLARFPDYVDAHNNLGVALARAGRLGESEAEFRWVIERDPTLRKAQIGLAAVLTSGGRADEAMVIYEKILAADPDCIEALTGLSVMLVTHPVPERNDPDRAVELARRAVELGEGKDVQTLEALAIVYYGADRKVEALETLDKAIGLAAASPAAAAGLKARRDRYAAEAE